MRTESQIEESLALTYREHVLVAGTRVRAKIADGQRRRPRAAPPLSLRPRLREISPLCGPQRGAREARRGESQGQERMKEKTMRRRRRRRRSVRCVGSVARVRLRRRRRRRRARRHWRSCWLWGLAGEVREMCGRVAGAYGAEHETGCGCGWWRRRWRGGEGKRLSCLGSKCSLSASLLPSVVHSSTCHTCDLTLCVRCRPHTHSRTHTVRVRVCACVCVCLHSEKTFYREHIL